MAWQVDQAVWIERFPHGAAKLISHVLSPFTDPAIGEDPFALTLAYLQAVRTELGIKDSELRALQRTLPSQQDSRQRQDSDATTGSLLRWQLPALDVRAGTLIVMIQQTHDGADVPGPGAAPLHLDVQGSGLRVVLHRTAPNEPWRATSVTSTLRRDFNFVPSSRFDRRLDLRLSADGRQRSAALLPVGTVNDVLRNFGFGTIEQKPGERLVRADLFIHQTILRGQERRTRGAAGAEPAPQEADFAAVAFRIVPPPPGVNAGRDAGRVNRRADMPPYELIARIPDGAPLQARALLTHAMPPAVEGAAVEGPAVEGKVFLVDPITATGIFQMHPGAGSDRLNPHRTSVQLSDMLPGTPPWRLSGRFVHVEDISVPGNVGYDPPSPPAPQFDYDARSNEFAAVNAYHHLTTMLRRIEQDFGLPFESFAAGFSLPVRALHRAAITPGPCTDGNCVNAQVMLLPPDVDPKEPADAEPRMQFRFALADLSLNPGSVRRPLVPLGIACDVRIVWHEFCHALIGAATNEPEFPFAHSAGDALAAINCDPGSRLAEPPFADTYRGVTFPWAAYANRRHDRDVGEGWSWTGPLGTPNGYHHDIRDMSGYSREQVLSTTLFRLYRSLGGDAVHADGSTDLQRRQAAADYATYLIVAAIRSLGLAITSPANDAGAFADALSQADVGLWALETQAQVSLAPMGRIGGTAHKVIRWAFEKQGYYKASGAGHAGAGDPPPIDLYLEDAAGRHGEYAYTEDWTAAASALWNRHAADGADTHEAPSANVQNFVYVRVNNRGSSDAPDARVSIWWTKDADARSWPGAQWEPLALAPGGSAQGVVPAGREAVLGPYLWQPPGQGRFALLAAVDAAGDLSNTIASSMIPCTLTPGLVEYLVPTDNNLGLGRWQVA